MSLSWCTGCKNNPDADPVLHRTWQNYGGGSDQSKFFIQDQIDKDNVQNLKIAWSYGTGDESSYQNNPIIVDTVMYILAKNFGRGNING